MVATVSTWRSAASVGVWAPAVLNVPVMRVAPCAAAVVPNSMTMAARAASLRMMFCARRITLSSARRCFCFGGRGERAAQWSDVSLFYQLRSHDSYLPRSLLAGITLHDRVLPGRIFAAALDHAVAAELGSLQLPNERGDGGLAVAGKLSQLIE